MVVVNFVRKWVHVGFDPNYRSAVFLRQGAAKGIFVIKEVLFVLKANLVKLQPFRDPVVRIPHTTSNRRP